MVLRQVQDDLESEGFEVQCFLIPASGIGAWHQRYRVWIVGHSEHNGSLTSKIKRRNTETTTGTQEGTNTTGEPARTSGSRDNEDVSNTNTRLSIGENEEIQARGNSIACSSSRGGEENVSNTEIIGTRESRNIDQEKGSQSSSSTQSDGSSEDVSNTDSGLRGRGRTIEQSGENKVWRFYSKRETNVTNSNSERQQEQWRNLSTKSKGERLRSESERRSWWQIESELCGVPNGISYGLDKGRVNRIKTLGNAIVPQIARELGLAIKKVMNEDTNI
jgi:site-specific DNA-cytosine methylase